MNVEAFLHQGLARAQKGGYKVAITDFDAAIAAKPLPPPTSNAANYELHWAIQKEPKPIFSKSQH